MIAFTRVLILALGILGQDHRYVVPDISSVDICPGQPCLTLGQFTEMADRYFTTGSTFHFLAGNHSLHTALSLANVSNITLRGDLKHSAPSIFLGNKATIRCTNVSKFHIEELFFILCKKLCREESCLQLVNSGRCDLFQGSMKETRLTTRSIYSQNSVVTILNCVFKRNSGGAILIPSDIGENIITVTGSTFTGNRATEAGGAISAAGYGATIILEGNPANVFKHNTAGSTGGALDCIGCMLILTGKNTFQDNSVFGDPQYGSGGAVYTYEGTLNISGVVVFSQSIVGWSIVDSRICTTMR